LKYDRAGKDEKTHNQIVYRAKSASVRYKELHEQVMVRATGDELLRMPSAATCFVFFRDDIQELMQPASLGALFEVHAYWRLN
jgi:hypothetical protein